MELRYYQKDAVRETFDWFRQNKEGNPLVVLPTGAGKSLVQAEFVRHVTTRWPNQRVLLLAHRKELLSQTAEALTKHCPEVSFGMYSAGLKKRQLGRKVTIGGIQSVFRKGEHIGWKSLVLVDEVHLFSSEEAGMYKQLIDDLMRFNPKLRLIGLTATPFRMGSGLLIDDGGLFTDIAYEIGVKRLIDEGYLCRLISKRSVAQADLSNVHIRAGDFMAREMEAAFDTDELTKAAIAEMLKYGHDRKSWLIFATGVSHAMHVTEALRKHGIDAECVTGDTEHLFRDQHVARFKAGALRVLVNCAVYTTGFNAPNVDMIVLLRSTKSTGLYVQMVGRGLRLHPSKQNTLVLDMGGNLEEHGPIDEIQIVRRKNPLTEKMEGEVSTAPVKTCPTCQTALALRALECPECGFVFPEREFTHAPTASSAAVLSDEVEVERLEVSSVDYRRHERSDKPPMLVVTYVLGNLSQVKEYVCLEHSGMSREQAERWWAHHTKVFMGREEIPETIEEALRRLGELKAVNWIEVKRVNRFDRVVSFGADEAANKEEAEARTWLEEQGVNI